MKNEAGAIGRFQAAIKAGPKTPDVHFGYGYLLWRDLRFNEAESEFNAELANNPDHALALTYLADTEIHLNHADEAVPHLEHALQVQPSIALAHLDLGVTYAGQGRNKDAFRELEEAERLAPVMRRFTGRLEGSIKLWGARWRPRLNSQRHAHCNRPPINRWRRNCARCKPSRLNRASTRRRSEPLPMPFLRLTVSTSSEHPW